MAVMADQKDCSNDSASRSANTNPDRLTGAISSRCSFTSFAVASEEATLSRILSGQHFRSDLTAGHRLGRDVADFVFDHFLTRVRGSEDFQNR